MYDHATTLCKLMIFSTMVQASIHILSMLCHLVWLQVYVSTFCVCVSLNHRYNKIFVEFSNCTTSGEHERKCMMRDKLKCHVVKMLWLGLLTMVNLHCFQCFFIHTHIFSKVQKTSKREILRKVNQFCYIHCVFFQNGTSKIMFLIIGCNVR